MTSPTNAYKQVQSVDNLPEFMSYWQEKLKNVSENSVFDKKGQYYIKTKKKYPFGKKHPIDVISETQFFHIANKCDYPKDTDKGTMDTIARIAELLAIRKIMQILVKYKQNISLPLIQFCSEKEHALYDIFIPYIDMYIDVKSLNVRTAEVHSDFEKRTHSGASCYFHHNKNKEKDRVLKLIHEQTDINLEFYSFPFSINIPKFRYNKLILDSDVLTPSNIEGSTLPGVNTSLKTVVSEITDERNKQYDKYYRIKHMDKTEKEFLEHIEQRIKDKINEGKK